MANINKTTLFTLSALFGLATVALVYYMLRPQLRGTSIPRPVTVQVVIARETISPRTTIRPEALAYRTVEDGKQPPNAVTGFDAAMGKVAVTQIPGGTPITADMLATRGPALGLSYDLKPFQRAVTVPIDPVSGVAGYLKPGDRVDVLATYTGQENNTARVVLQDRELLAIGNEPTNTANAKESPNKPADAVTATLVVDADQVALLALTAAKAKIHLALRSPDDHAIVIPKPITTTQVFGGERKAASPGAPMPPLRMELTTSIPSAPAAPKHTVKAPARQRSIEVTRGTDTKTIAIQ